VFLAAFEVVTGIQRLGRNVKCRILLLLVVNFVEGKLARGKPAVNTRQRASKLCIVHFVLSVSQLDMMNLCLHLFFTASDTSARMVWIMVDGGS